MSIKHKISCELHLGNFRIPCPVADVGVWRGLVRHVEGAGRPRIHGLHTQPLRHLSRLVSEKFQNVSQKSLDSCLILAHHILPQ